VDEVGCREWGNPASGRGVVALGEKRREGGLAAGSQKGIYLQYNRKHY